MTPEINQPSDLPRLLLACDGGHLEEVDQFMRSVARLCGLPPCEADILKLLTVAWPPKDPRAILTLQRFKAPGSLYAVDLGYILDEHAWITHEMLDFQRFEGFVLVADSCLGKIRTVLGRQSMIRRSLRAFGRDDASMPCVIALTHADADPRTRHTPQSAHDCIADNRYPLVEVECGTGRGVAEAVDHLVRAALDARHAEPSRLDVRCPEDPPDISVPLPPCDPDTILHLVGSGDHPAALRRLLDVWRACRATAVAELIESLSYVSRSPRPHRVTHRWWTEACRRREVMDLPVLLDTVLIRESATSLATHVVQVAERLGGLRWWEDDPRTTPRLASLLADLTYYRKVPVQVTIGQVLGAHGDPRAFRAYRRYRQDLPFIRPPFTFRTSEIINALPQSRYRYVDACEAGIPRDVIVPREHQDAWDALAERIRRPLPRPEDMQAIAADPANDELRRELAEGMRERGDPRGEFILLQLAKAAGSLSPEEHERELALKRTYAWDWLGPLADVVDVENCVFEKGYPVKVTVWTPNTRALRDVIGKPEWATIREMRWGGDPCWEEEAPDPALINHPVMKSLQSVTTKMPEDPAELEALRRVAWAR